MKLIDPTNETIDLYEIKHPDESEVCDFNAFIY